MLTKNIGKRMPRASLKNAHNTSAGNDVATVTLAATPGRIQYVHHVQWSYNPAPTGGRLTITVAGNTKFEVDILAGGPGGFGIELAGGVNEAIVITLAAGGGGVVGKLNVQYTTEGEKSF